jgi:type IV pilus assembly protein PilB
MNQEPPDPLVESLQEMGVLTQAQVEKACKAARVSGLSVLDQLTAEHVLTPRDVACAQAARCGVKYIDLAEVKPSDEALAAVPQNIALRYQALPLYLQGNTLTVVIGDPTDFSKVDTLQALLHKTIETEVANADDLQKAIQNYYASS